MRIVYVENVPGHILLMNFLEGGKAAEGRVRRKLIQILHFRNTTIFLHKYLIDKLSAHHAHLMEIERVTEIFMVLA